MLRLPPALVPVWPLLAAIASAAMLATAHAFERIGGYAPCELCLRQREVYWAALAVGLIGFFAARLTKRPVLLSVASLLLGVVFLVGAGIAAYHAGVEWKWWPGPQSCTGAGSVDAGAMAALISGAKIAPPACDEAAWRLLGLSMAGWNVLVSLALALVSFAAMGGRRRGLDPV